MEHIVTQLTEHVPQQHREVAGLIIQTANAGKLPSCWCTIDLIIIVVVVTLIVVVLILITVISITAISGVIRVVSPSSGRCWSLLSLWYWAAGGGAGESTAIMSPSSAST